MWRQCCERCSQFLRQWDWTHEPTDSTISVQLSVVEVQDSQPREKTSDVPEVVVCDPQERVRQDPARSVCQEHRLLGDNSFGECQKRLIECASNPTENCGNYYHYEKSYQGMCVCMFYVCLHE